MTVTDVLPDEGIGRFDLLPHQHNPFNAFVSLERLQRALEQPGQVNAILVGDVSPDSDPNDALAGVVTLDDLGILLRRAEDHLTVESREFILRPDVARTVGESLEDLQAPFQPVHAYLANKLRTAERLIPYSPIAGVDALEGVRWAELTWVAGEQARPLPPDGIVLNEWAARDLGVEPGDSIGVEYFEVGPREELIVRERTFRVQGVVAIDGLAADAGLTPEYPGIQDADDMAGWDPPFPVDLDLIRPEDEAYWDRYRALPKAFVPFETSVELWSTRFGDTTSIRFGAGVGANLDETEARFRDELRERLRPESFGFALRPVKVEGLSASTGATDFGGLFIGFSMFLIVSAALLVSLLFSLGVEQRAGEVGLLLAVGYRVRKVRNRLLGEAGAIAVVGALLGLLVGVAYAALMMTGLRTIWLPAVGSSRLFLHVEPRSLILGWLISVLMILFSIWLRVRSLKRVPPPRLLAGSLTIDTPAKQARLSRLVSVGCLVLALGLVAYAASSGAMDNPTLAFGSGALLLVSGLGFFSWWCRGTARRKRTLKPRAGILALAARNSSWNPGRSVLSVALVACASFVIVAVGANRQQFGEELRSRESGSGGFALLAESQVPVYQSFNRRADLLELGFDEEAVQRIGDAHTIPFRVLPGEDASCLNLYQPETPRVLGVPHELVERGGFVFQKSLDLPEGADSPWDLLERPLEDGVIPAIGDYASTQWILHLGLGNELELMNELGETVRLRLVATLKSTVFQSELLISEEQFLEHFPGRGGYGYFLIDAPASDEHEIARTLEAGLAPFGLDVTTTREKLESYKVVEHTYLATFQMVGGLGLLLGTVGLGVILLRNVLERRGELATLRAFGFRRSTLASMILAENAFLLVAGILVGTVAALVAVAPRLASIDVPWGSLALTLGVVLVVGMLSSLAAVRGALRVPLLPALKAER
jgi:ABC-type lipoprotein release transport system permease subunit